MHRLPLTLKFSLLVQSLPAFKYKPILTDNSLESENLDEKKNIVIPGKFHDLCTINSDCGSAAHSAKTKQIPVVTLLQLNSVLFLFL